MSVLRYFLPNGGDILLNFTHIMDFFAEWKAADSENNFLYHLFWFLYYNNQFKMHNNFKQTKIKRTGQSPLKQSQVPTPGNLRHAATGNVSFQHSADDRQIATVECPVSSVG